MIQVNHLTKKFGEFTAVNNVSFEIKAGETFALLGPNGSGKTTALKCLVGLMPPTKGEIKVDGLDVWKEARQAKSRMSYLPQYVNFHDHLTAREVMQFYCKLRKLPTTRIDAVLQSSHFHFNGFTDKPVSQFSGGMLQRLGLAVASLPDAPILLLDEPTASLDPERAIQFRAFLATLKQAGKTIVFTSHVLADVEQLADRVAILVEGKLVALESIQALRENLMLGSQMRVELLNPSESLVTVAQQAGASAVVVQERALLITSAPEARLGILAAIKAAGGEVVRFATEEPSLEDIYLQYIKQESAK
jgi:ABC-type multidrug transport system ATPase subunit